MGLLGIANQPSIDTQNTAGADCLAYTASVSVESTVFIVGL